MHPSPKAVKRCRLSEGYGHRKTLAANWGNLNDPTVWTGRVLQAGCERWRGLVLRFCIRPVNRAFMLLAIMDIRTHPISFCERP